MEATQRMNVSSEEEEDDVEREKFHTTVYGRLTVVLDPQSKIEKTYDIFGGENKIGRDPEQSRIVVDNKSLSRTHAVIEVSRDGTILLYDDHSMNGTLRNGSKLKPGVHYAIHGSENLSFGDLKASFVPVVEGAATPIKNSNGSKYFVPETPIANLNAAHDSFSTSSPLEPGTSAIKHALASSPETPDKTGDESSVFIAPSQPVSTFVRHQEPGAERNMSKNLFKLPESQPYRADLDEEPPTDTQTEAFGSATMGFMELETQQYQSEEVPKETKEEPDLEEEKVPDDSQSNSTDNPPKEKEGYEAEAPQFDEDEIENMDDQGSKSEANKTAATEILSQSLEATNQANVETQLFTIDLALHANVLKDESTEATETLDLCLEPDSEEKISKENSDVDETEETVDARSETNEPSSPTHPVEDLECATQLNLDETSDDPINLNFDDSSRNFSDISISESCDRDIFESSPKDLSTNANESMHAANISATLMENLEENDMESRGRVPSPDFQSPSSPYSEDEENLDEYVESYHGASQLIAESNPDNDKKLKDGNEESDDDFIASSQISGPDRTNFVTRPMSLTTIKESSPIEDDESLSQIEESDLGSEIDNSDMKSSQGEQKMEITECDQFDLPSIPGSSTGTLDTSTPVESDQIEKADEQRPISAQSSETDRLCGEDDSEKFLESTQSLMEFQNAAISSEKIRDADKISEDLAPTTNAETSKEVFDVMNVETDSDLKTKCLSPKSSSPKPQDVEKFTFSNSQSHKTDATEKVTSTSLNQAQVQEIVLTETKDEKQEESEMIKTETADHSIEKMDSVDPGLGILQTNSKIAELFVEVPGSSSGELERSENNCNVRIDSANQRIKEEAPEKSTSTEPASEIPSPSHSETSRISLESSGQVEPDRKSPSLKVNRRCKQTPTKIDTTINESGIDPVIAQRHIDMDDTPKTASGRSRRSRQSTVNESLPAAKAPTRAGRRVKQNVEDHSRQDDVSDLQVVENNDTNVAKKYSKRGPNAKEALLKTDDSDRSQETNTRKVQPASKKIPVEVEEEPTTLRRGIRSGRKSGTLQTEVSKPEANEGTLKLRQTRTGLKREVNPPATEQSPVKRGRGRPSKSSMLPASSEITEQNDKKVATLGKPAQSSATSTEAATKPDTPVKRRGRPPSKSPNYQNLVPYSTAKGNQSSEPELKPNSKKRSSQGNLKAIESQEENQGLESTPNKKGRGSSNLASTNAESTSELPNRRRGRPKAADRQSNASINKTELDEELPKPKRGRPSRATKEEPVEEVKGKGVPSTSNSKLPPKQVKEECSEPESSPQPRSTRASLLSASAIVAIESKRKRCRKLSGGISTTENAMETEVSSMAKASSSEAKKSRGRAQSKSIVQDPVVVKEEDESSPEKKFKQEPPKRGRVGKSHVISDHSPSPSGSGSRSRKLDVTIKQEPSMMEICRARMSASLSSVDSGHSGSRPKQKPVVMFTGFESKLFEKTVKDLGGTLNSDPSSCTVLVTDKVRRTVKFLCAIGRGIPIVSQQWLVACKAAKIFLDPWNHILVDEESEKKWGFRLKSSLETARRIKLLEDFSVYATKKCVPPPSELKDIIECAGGKWLRAPPTVANSKTFAVSCPEDAAEKSKLASKNVRIYDKEILLSGLLTQTLDFDKFSM